MRMNLPISSVCCWAQMWYVWKACSSVAILVVRRSNSCSSNKHFFFFFSSKQAYPYTSRGSVVQLCQMTVRRVGLKEVNLFQGKGRVLSWSLFIGRCPCMRMSTFSSLVHLVHIPLPVILHLSQFFREHMAIPWNISIDTDSFGTLVHKQNWRKLARLEVSYKTYWKLTKEEKTGT